MKINSFEDIESWKKARELTNNIYDHTENGKFANDWDLKRQIRRSCESIMSNIAEGFERDGNREFVQFLSVAKGSCGEARSQLYLALDRGYVSEKQFNELMQQMLGTSRLIAGFMRYLRYSQNKGSKFRSTGK